MLNGQPKPQAPTRFRSEREQEPLEQATLASRVILGETPFGLEPGVVVDRTYRIARELGRGGMGVVLLAQDERLERAVAIKLIRPELLDERDLRARFLSEARAMARVCHPNVLPIYALGEHEGMPYFVSELVDGQTVEQWLRAVPPGSPTDLDAVLRILDDTCRGVEAIHAAATVHRDLKPSNLLIDQTFRVRVADLGVADLVRRRADAKHELVGTPEYMAPENVLQEAVPAELVHRADVYALGCIAFELLTGRPPFSGSSALARMVAQVNDEAPRPSTLRAGLAPGFDDVVLHALAKDPRERTPSAEAFRRALAAVRDGIAEPVRILLADDDDDFCEILESALAVEFPGATIERASDGRSALQAFDRKQPSIVIADLGMPNLDGIELTRRLRGRDGSESVPILVLTASGGPTEWKRLSAMGADGFLVKPVNLRDVITLVRRSLTDRARTSAPPVSL
jgi:serine/threonine-protein kinase